MPMAGFDQLFAEADAARRGLAVAVAGGADRTVLEALRSACDRGWIEPLVAGPESDVRRVADEGGISLE
ncbi:MAG TPA: phosphate butyryltransferase, partial [Pirellulales bacterium]|nr:phosphate butyryltransferase [Pirellulales bacterium]